MARDLTPSTVHPMKLWLFQFTDQHHKLLSARVAAPDRILACCTMETVLEHVDPMVLLPLSKRPAEGVLLSYLGETAAADSCVISAVTRSGAMLENEGAR